MQRIERYFPLSHGIARVDDRRIVSALVFVIKNGLRWRDAPRDYGPHKTIYNRFIRWSRLGVFNKIFAELARKCAAASGARDHRFGSLWHRLGRVRSMSRSGNRRSRNHTAFSPDLRRPYAAWMAIQRIGSRLGHPSTLNGRIPAPT